MSKMQLLKVVHLIYYCIRTRSKNFMAKKAGKQIFLDFQVQSFAKQYRKFCF